ncbi:PREDICTED: neuropeptide Y receptor type 5 isoform X2 [Elephantulus edwardii]|uniref:neuropeptide Y receptor type 5 isoform X1 n=1 Tax=Elephantulus edwardii TaxID=28737 RepID=UPI0003F0C754|nr:PREDICTED: neuropeptide Y receptor type 5 isoform X1 [Elephantulus edwardii]XP_006892832.1 PREDICTED: neuropeptide Y receptor type 5 isoform X2 [Elephantulus edwardii]
MDLQLKEYYNKTLATENNTAATRNSGFPNWDDYKSSVDDLQYFLIGLYTFVSLLGFMGNLLILMALMRKRNQKTIVNFLIGNLAFSDILIVLFCSPFTLTSILLDQWMFGKVMCHIMPFLQCVSVLVSTLILISIAIVRYHMIKYPLSNSLTANHGYFLVATVWTLGFAICSPLPVFHSLVGLQETFGSGSMSSKYLCIESWPSDAYRIAFTISLLLVQYILPLVCLTVSHTSVCRSVSCELSSKENSVEEHEMINLTVQPSKKNGPPVKLSSSHKWSYSFIQKHRRRYSKKTACVLPAPVSPLQEKRSVMQPQNGSVRTHFSSSSKIIPGIPTCFEMKAEEISDNHEMRVKRSIIRFKKKSRSIFYRLTILILVFAVSWMPLHLFHVVTDFNDNLISNRHFKLVYCICHLLGMMSCCLNPILYGFLNNGIKADLISLIHCLHMS